MLTLTFLGVGSAFAKQNFNSNALIEAWSVGPVSRTAPDDNLLIDFGATGPLALYKLKDQPGFEYLRRGSQTHWPAIRRVFLTHQHSDHIGGLEELACCNVHLANAPESAPFRPQLWAEATLLESLWNNSLSGGLGVLDGRAARLEDYFETRPLRYRPLADGRCHSEPIFTLMDRYEFRHFPTDHIRIRHKYDWPSYGLHLTDARTGRTAFYSGDTRFDPQAYGAMMSAASVCFHEVQLSGDPQPVHTPIGLLRGLPADIRAKTWLYHYDDTWADPSFACVSDEFAGFAVPGQRYTLFE